MLVTILFSSQEKDRVTTVVQECLHQKPTRIISLPSRTSQRSKGCQATTFAPLIKIAIENWWTTLMEMKNNFLIRKNKFYPRVFPLKSKHSPKKNKKLRRYKLSQRRRNLLATGSASNKLPISFFKARNLEQILLSSFQTIKRKISAKNLIIRGF